jgi:hypothetical protein
MMNLIHLSLHADTCSVSRVNTLSIVQGDRSQSTYLVIKYFGMPLIGSFLSIVGREEEYL